MASSLAFSSLSSQLVPLHTQEIPALRYKASVYSDGKEWVDSSGIRLFVEETWIPSKEVAYNKIQGVFYAKKPRPAQKDACSTYCSPFKPISLTEAQLSELLAGIKKDTSEHATKLLRKTERSKT